MKRLRSRRAALIASLAAALVAASVLAADGATARTASPTLVVDNSFTIKTSDPERAFDPDRVARRPRASTTRSSPTRAATWRIRSRCSCRRARRARTRRRSRSSSSGTSTSPTARRSRRPTSSSRCRRLINLKGNPSFLLAGVTVSAPAKYTVVMRSKTPATPAAGRSSRTRRPGILNSTLVKKNGGTDAVERGQGRQGRELAQLVRARPAPAAARTRCSAYSTTSQITLDAEHEATGARRSRRGRASSSATWSRRPSCSTSAAARTRSRSTSSADQAQTLKGNKNVNVSLQPSTWIFFGCSRTTTRRSRRSRRTRTSRRRSATGSTTPSIVEPRRPGRDPGARASSRRCSSARCRRAHAVKTNVAKAKAALAASGVGEPEGDARLPERPDDQRRPVHVDGAEGPGEPARRSASTSSSRARRPSNWLTTTAAARWRSASRSGARTTRIPPTTSTFTPGRARRPARRLAEGRRPRRSRSSPPRRR